MTHTHTHTLCQHELLENHDLDLEQVKDIALFAQQGNDIRRSLEQVVRKKEKEGGDQDLGALRTASEAHPSAQTQVWSCEKA